ncbi:MAG: glycosyl hydrolase [Bryobacteraceae bacterium]|nr:glycosyl hydrolase [Bryobacteraceae bacterium]
MTLRYTLLLSLATGALLAQETAKPLWSKLEWRSIGPYRGGRVTAVAGITSQPDVYYFGATGGGVFKTTDGGVNWTPVSDGHFGTGSVGAIGVSESDPNIVYVGMGESPIRGNVSHGDGVYKSLDAGKTWKRVGLEDTQHIGRVRVHPKNPDIVYVAALGHIFGPNEQRGIFRSTDGGKTWQRILHRNNDTGAIDLAMDPSNPRVLYAGFWQVKRTPYSLESGGPGSGIFKTVDGGDTWTEITRNNGLPKGTIGKMGLAVSPLNSERVYAIIEAEDGGVFRSDDGGTNWTRVNQNRNLRQRAWYYTRIYADPQRVNTIYVLNVGFWRSDDGGRTFTTVPTPHGDNHDLWIAGNNSNRMVQGNDGGANVSVNGGRTWTEQDQATAQFYRVTVDDDFPYNVYGAQQDNTTVRTASRTAGFGIGFSDWWPVGGCESGWIAPWPKDSNVVYAGCYSGYISRYDHRTRQNRNITVWPDNPMGYGAEGMKYRFQWNFPILFSPHDPNLLYTASNILFKTTNEGQSWEAISPDLTRNDKSKLGPSGGPITKDNTGVEYYATIFTVAESTLTKGLIWAGTDDGLVHITRDGGKKWENITPKDMPEWIQINSIEASPHDPATAYVAATMYKSDDFRPYLYKTSDYGRTWKKIVTGIKDDAFTRVVREDPYRRGLLYAGTELGMYVSFNDGERWESLQNNLPVVPITDLVIHKRDKDLVAATQGRSFWILDDLTVLHQMTDKVREANLHLFQPEEAYRFGGGSFRRAAMTVGENPPAGVVVHYWLKSKPKELSIEFLDAAGKLVRKFSTADKPEEGAGQQGGGDDEEGPRPGPAARLQPVEGLNRFVWNMRYPDASRFPGLIMWMGPTTGPLASPGKYTVKLTADGATGQQTFVIKKDPRLATTQEDFDKQLALLLQIRDKVTQTHDAVKRIRDVRKQLDDVAARYNDQAITEAAKALGKKLSGIEEQLYQTKNQSSQDPLNYPIQLNNKLAHLTSVVGSADTQPTQQSYLVYEDLTTKINAHLKNLDGLLNKDLSEFNKLVRDKNLPAVK